jgi:hypothetical protein
MRVAAARAEIPPRSLPAVSTRLGSGFATRPADQSVDLSDTSEHRSHVHVPAVGQPAFA